MAHHPCTSHKRAGTRYSPRLQTPGYRAVHGVDHHLDPPLHHTRLHTSLWFGFPAAPDAALGPVGVCSVRLPASVHTRHKAHTHKHIHRYKRLLGRAGGSRRTLGRCAKMRRSDRQTMNPNGNFESGFNLTPDVTDISESIDGFISSSQALSAAPP